MKLLNKYALATATALFALALAGCAEKKSGKEREQESNSVEVARPLQKEVEIWDNYTARIEASKSVDIRSRISGYLEKICFKDGDFVNAGDVLFEIDPRPFEALVEASEAAVKEIQSRIDLAKSNLLRAQDLYKANAISKEILETRKSELASADAVLMSARAKLKEAVLNLEFTKTRSPISGYISRRRVDEGNLIDASSTLMATVVSRDVVYAYFEISERDIIKYTSNKLFESIDVANHSGPPVKLSMLDEIEPSHFGQLTYMDNSLSASSIELRAEIDNSKGRLFPGMFTKVSLRGGAPVKRLLLPESSVGTDLVGRYVILVGADNKAEYRKVAVGDMVGKMQIILDGITEDDLIVVKGLHRAQPHKIVTPILTELK